MNTRMRLFAGTAHPQFARDLCAHLGIDLSPSEAFFFSDGNLFVKIDTNVRGREVFLVQTAYFGPSRPGVSVHADHPFHFMPTTCFGVADHPFR